MLRPNAIKTRADGAVLFAQIDSPPMNLIGPELVDDLVSLIEVLDRGDHIAWRSFQAPTLISSFPR